RDPNRRVCLCRQLRKESSRNNSAAKLCPALLRRQTKSPTRCRSAAQTRAANGHSFGQTQVYAGGGQTSNLRKLPTTRREQLLSRGYRDRRSADGEHKYRSIGQAPHPAIGATRTPHEPVCPT